MKNVGNLINFTVIHVRTYLEMMITQQRQQNFQWKYAHAGFFIDWLQTTLYIWLLFPILFGTQGSLILDIAIAS